MVYTLGRRWLGWILRQSCRPLLPPARATKRRCPCHPWLGLILRQSCSTPLAPARATKKPCPCHPCLCSGGADCDPRRKTHGRLTGLSASGPAYIHIIRESLAEAGERPACRAMWPPCWRRRRRWAARVVLETGDHPALLKDAVTTPAGCTIDGILTKSKGKLRVL